MYTQSLSMFIMEAYTASVFCVDIQICYCFPSTKENAACKWQQSQPAGNQKQ